MSTKSFTLTRGDRGAIKRWASNKFPGLVQSANGEVLWGRGGRYRSLMTPWGPRTWLNAGVRMARGRLVVENSRSKQVADVPLSYVAAEIVSAMAPPEFHRWQVTDGVGLLAFCDWLVERDEHRWAARIRRWADLAIQDIVSPRAVGT